MTNQKQTAPKLKLLPYQLVGRDNRYIQGCYKLDSTGVVVGVIACATAVLGLVIARQYWRHRKSKKACHTGEGLTPTEIYV